MTFSTLFGYYGQWINTTLQQVHLTIFLFSPSTPIFKKLTSIVHLFPILGTYITLFGSTEGTGSVEQARELNNVICQQSDDDTRQLPYLHAAIRAWWIAEYSGWYMEGAAGDGLPGVDLDTGKPFPSFPL